MTFKKTILKKILPFVVGFFFALSLLMLSPIAQGQEFDKGDVYWLTQNIYHESRNQPLLGQLMVGLVSLERLSSGKWGNTIREVVTHPNQFSWYSKNKPNIPKDINAWKTSKLIAVLSIKAHKIIEGHKIMYYHNNKVNPYWASIFDIVLKIDDHTFYIE